MLLLSPLEHDIAGDQETDLPLKALVVDDSNLDRLILQKLLMKNGYDVYVAVDGHSAIEIYKETRPDIVFMDLYLPETSGYEITKKIKKISEGEYIPIIFVTGATDDAALEQCLDSGGDDFIVKPVKESLLKAKVGALLRIKKMHDEVLVEKEVIATYAASQTKDLHDADKVIENIHSPLFYNSGNINWSYIAQNILSGDILCSAMSPSGKHIILIGDNTGHGLPAAIGSIITCEIFYSMVAKGFDIHLIIEEINKKLYRLLSTDRFLAACIIEIDAEYQLMRVWNAGMPDIIINSTDGDLKQCLPSIHLPLGITLINENDVVPVNVKLEAGDCIYGYSDGLIDVFNENGEIFGEQRLLEFIQSMISTGSRVDKIIDNVKDFRGDVLQSDDILLLEIICDETLINKKKKNDLDSNKITPANWNVQLELGADIIRNTNPVPILIQAMSDLQGLNNYREKLFLILTEMYSNSVEHGILDLDSSMKHDPSGFLSYYEQREKRLEKIEEANLKINIGNHVEGSNGVVSISIEDSGNGFDFENVTSSLDGNNSNSGRGIALMKSLCRSFEYSKNGKMLNIEYEWNEESLKE